MVSDHKAIKLKINFFNYLFLPLLVWFSWLECCLVNQKVEVSIPSQGTYQVVILIPVWGTYEKAANQCFSNYIDVLSVSLNNNEKKCPCVRIFKKLSSFSNELSLHLCQKLIDHICESIYGVSIQFLFVCLAACTTLS